MCDVHTHFFVLSSNELKSVFCELEKPYRKSLFLHIFNFINPSEQIWAPPSKNIAVEEIKNVEGV